ncbi:MAG: hypothetical protein ACRC42_02825 [Mycoplasma sp.]
MRNLRKIKAIKYLMITSVIILLSVFIPLVAISETRSDTTTLFLILACVYTIIALPLSLKIKYRFYIENNMKYFILCGIFKRKIIINDELFDTDSGLLSFRKSEFKISGNSSRLITINISRDNSIYFYVGGELIRPSKVSQINE